MRVIDQSFKILEQDVKQIRATDEDLVNELKMKMYKHIEECGRTCYKSEDRITDDSCIKFVNNMIKNKHYAMLEHGTVYLYYIFDIESEYVEQHKAFVEKYKKNPYSRVVEEIKPSKYSEESGDLYIYYITTNYRVIIENGWEDDLQHWREPEPQHIRRYTAKLTTNIQVYKDLTRHRTMSFAIESTRFCNYTKEKFGGELTYIIPWKLKQKYTFKDLRIKEDGYWDIQEFRDDETYHYNIGYFVLYKLWEIESAYKMLVEDNWAQWLPQEASTLLPQATKADVCITGFADDWQHMFNLRVLGTTGAPHPQVKEIMEQVYAEFIRLDYIHA